MADKMNQIAAQVAHSIDLQKLANSISRDSSKRYDELAKLVRSIMLDYDVINTKKLLNEITKTVVVAFEDAASDINDEMQGEINKVIREEINFQYAVVSAISSKNPVKPKLSEAKKAILDQPLVLNKKAMTWERRISSFTDNQVQEVKRIIMTGWANGETVNDITKLLVGTRTQNGLIQQSKSAANALAKDLITHSSSMTKADFAKKNDDIVIGEKAIVTLDSRTSPICQDYGSQDSGGKEWYYDKDGRRFPRSPFHYRCRTVMIFIIAPEFDLEIETTRPAVVDGKAIQVDSKTNWMDLAKRYDSIAEQALGKTRAKLIDNMSAKEFQRVAFNSLNEYKTLDEMVASSKKVASLLKDD